MLMDPRCKRLNELSDQYHMMFRQLAERYLDQLCTECQLREALCIGDYLLLYKVGECGDEPANMAAISKELNINPSTATRRVNRLLNDGLVTKSSAPDDDRRYDLRLTHLGAGFLGQMNERLHKAVGMTYEPVTDREMQTVYRFMEKCIDQLEKLLENT